MHKPAASIALSTTVKPATVILAVLAFAGCWYFATVFLSTVGVKLHHSDFFPLWNGSQAVMHGVDPYGDTVTLQNQISAYGTTAAAIGEKNEQRFAYPLYATFPILPLTLLPFHVANRILICTMGVLTALSVGWIRGRWDAVTALYIVLTFASYPVAFALQIGQPTLLFLSFAIGSVALLRAGHLWSAGVLAALSTAKPQVVCGILFAIFAWSVIRWRSTKSFFISFFIAMLGLLGISEAVSPHWMTRWVATLHAYAGYQHSPSVIGSFLGSKLGIIVSAFLFAGLIFVLWLRQESGLLYQVALAVTVVYVLLPEEAYNAPILMIPAIWVADQMKTISASGAGNQLAIAAARVALIELWLANLVAAILLHTNAQGKALAWWLPVNAVFPLLASLAVVLLLQLFQLSATEHPPTLHTIAADERVLATSGPRMNRS